MPPKVYKIEEIEIPENPDGSVTCPLCDENLKLGRAGFENFKKNHYNSPTCQKNATKRDKKKKAQKVAQKNKEAFERLLKPRMLKAPLVPSTLPPPSKLIAPEAPPLSPPEIPAVLEPLIQVIPRLPARLPCPQSTSADSNEETTFLATLPPNPALDDRPLLNADDLFEEVINGRLHDLFGWDTDTASYAERLRGLERERLVRLVDWVTYFLGRGIPQALFEGRLAPLVRALERVVRELRAPAVAPPTVLGNPCEVISLTDSEDEGERTQPNPTPKTPQDDTEAKGPEDLGPQLKGDLVPCPGYRPTIPYGLTPLSAYPFFLHHEPGYAWDFAVRSGVLCLYSRECCQLGDGRVCAPCQSLQKNDNLKNIMNRMQNGIRDGTTLPFYPFRALHNIINRKNQQIDFHRLRGLNQARKIVSITTSLDIHKRFVFALATNEIPRVQAVVRVSLRRKQGIRALLAGVLDAAKQLRRPKDYQEEEYLKGIVLWKLGGDRLATIAHCALGLPSVSTLCNQLRVPAIIASPGVPTEGEVERNISMGFEGVEDLLRLGEGVRKHHAILMLDELAVEPRIRWDPATNKFMGVCREHGHHISLDFASEKDLERLYAEVDEGTVHVVHEATIAALGLLSEAPRLQSPRAALVSSDCKQETGQEHAKLIKTIINGANQTEVIKDVRIICIDSDGETRRGAAFIILTFKRPLHPSSPIFIHVGNLFLMNIFVGDDDLTADKDWKHVLKRCRNKVTSASGITINNICVTPNVLRAHFVDAGLKLDHIKAILNPNDKQDVKLAFDLLKAIWGLPKATLRVRPGFQEARDAIHALGEVFFNLFYPYLCIDLSLHEQLAHLSTAAHLAFHHFHAHKKDFLNIALYIDIMIMIKNVFFCVAKTKVDNPKGTFYITLLGTDRLEEIFGTLRTMIGTDANVDILQLSWRLGGCTEVANILSMHPKWDRPPRRLKVPVLERNSTEATTSTSDHLKPRFWRGDVNVSRVSLPTAWKEGRKKAEEVCDGLDRELAELEAHISTNPVDILSPHGSPLIHNIPSDDEQDLDKATSMNTKPSDPDDDAEVEDCLGDLVEEIETSGGTGRQFEKTIVFDGLTIPKSRALAIYSKYRNAPSSTDRLKRVQNVARYTLQSTRTSSRIQSPADDENDQVLTTHDPVLSILVCDGRFWLSFGETISLSVDGRAVDMVLRSQLHETKTTVTYQLLGLRLATEDDDPTRAFDWRSHRVPQRTIKVNGRLVEPINPAIGSSLANPSSPFYLFKSTSLVAMSTSLLAQIPSRSLQDAPRIELTSTFPYREAEGKLCFLCEDKRQIAGLSQQEAIVCEYCDPPLALETSMGIKILEHMAAHIRHDPKAKDVAEPCGLCLRPSPACRIYVKKAPGRNGKDTIDRKRSECLNIAARFQYTTAATSNQNSPCSNVPLNCPLCPEGTPAVWRYNLQVHFRVNHPRVWESSDSRRQYEHLWALGKYEITSVSKFWQKILTAPSRRQTRGPGSKKRAKEAFAALEISEMHRSSNADVLITPDGDDEPFEEEGVVSSKEEGEAQSTDDESETAAVEEDFEKMDIREVSADSELNSDISYISEGETIQPAAVAPTSIETRPDNELVSDVPPPTLVDTAGTRTSGAINTVASLTELGRGHRLRSKRPLALAHCYCGAVVQHDEDGVAVCNRTGCETQRYHLACLQTDIVPRGWVCEACKAMQSKRAKR